MRPKPKTMPASTPIASSNLETFGKHSGIRLGAKDTVGCESVADITKTMEVLESLEIGSIHEDGTLGLAAEAHLSFSYLSRQASSIAHCQSVGPAYPVNKCNYEARPFTCNRVSSILLMNAHIVGVLWWQRSNH